MEPVDMDLVDFRVIIVKGLKMIESLKSIQIQHF